MVNNLLNEKNNRELSYFDNILGTKDIKDIIIFCGCVSTEGINSGDGKYLYRQRT